MVSEAEILERMTPERFVHLLNDISNGAHFRGDYGKSTPHAWEVGNKQEVAASYELTIWFGFYRNKLAAAEARIEVMERALDRIANKPIGHPEASFREVHDVIVGMARVALKKEGGG